MPLAEEPDLNPYGDPSAHRRWDYRDPADNPLPPDDPTQSICSRHAATIANLTPAAFGPHRKANGLPLRDWHFGTLKDVRARRDWCLGCRLIADAVDTAVHEDEAEVIACWVWDGTVKASEETANETGRDESDMATLRLRVAPEMVGWEIAFEPFDLVPLDTKSKDSCLFSGRLMNRDHLDLDLVRSWVNNCSSWHGSECADTTLWKTADWGVPFIRLLSLDENRLIETAQPTPYAALSYVWGSAPVYKTLQSNISALRNLNGLPVRQFPETIQDAIALARSVGFHHLWVDSLCIIQDSAADKAQQIRIMGEIYSKASLTIVAAAGDGANAGIPGLRPGSRSLSQCTARISDRLTLVALRPDSHRAAAATTWNTRGWTYQERLLSRRCLFSLPGGAIAFQCRRAVWGEDYCAETPGLLSCAPMMDIGLNRSWMAPGGVSDRGPAGVRTARTAYLQEYCRLMEEYTARNMTLASDRLLGIAGVLDVLRGAFGVVFLQGLPETVMHMALLWQPRHKLKRVPVDTNTGLPLFCSWSWAGWVGPVGYEDWNDFNGLPVVEERWKRVVPFAKLSKIAGDGSICPLQPFIHFKRQISDGWSEVSTPNDGTCYTTPAGPQHYHSVPFKSPAPPPMTTLSQPLALYLRTRTARFRLTNLVRTFDMNRTSAAVERKGRFGFAPSTSDEPWLGTVLLPLQYRGKLGQHVEAIVLSESYCFSAQEVGLSVARQLGPFAVYDVMVVRRVVGVELERYQARFRAAAGGPGTADWYSGKAVVERIGVGRMAKSAWTEDNEAWEEFLLV